MARLLLSVLITFIWGSSLFAQNPCVLLRDSIVNFDNSTYLYRQYQYDDKKRLAQIDYHEMGAEKPVTYATAEYDASGNLSLLSFYENKPEAAPFKQYKYRYEKNRISRIDASGVAGEAWTVSYKLSYDDEGRIKQVATVPLSIKGQPDDFTGSFTDIVWRDGNVVSFKIQIETLTMELTAEYDENENIYSLLPAEEIGQILEGSFKNNLVKIILNNSVELEEHKLGPGTVAMSRSYEFSAKKDLVSVFKKRALLLEESGHDMRLVLDCK